MHVRRGLLGWGVFLILAGAIPLAVRAGYLDADQVGRLWSLWPLILIGIGVGLILRRTRLEFLGGLIVAATLGLMVGGLLSVGSTGFAGGNCGGAGATQPFETRTGTFGATGSIDVQLNCGNADGRDRGRRRLAGRGPGRQGRRAPRSRATRMRATSASGPTTRADRSPSAITSRGR